MPGYDARAIANEFLKRAKRDGLALTNMQLQKLPYFAHGWSLALLDSPLIEEKPRAWPYGPVYRSLYESLRQYGSGPVLNLISDEEGEVLSANPSAKENDLIETVWNTYRKFTAYQLSDLTHQPGTPWSNTLANQIITNDRIKEHFKELKNYSVQNNSIGG